MIALDLCQLHYQNLLIIYLKFIAKNVEIKTTNLDMSLKDLKITNFLIIAKIVEKTVKTNKWISSKVFKYIQMLNGDINKFFLLFKKVFIHMNTWIVEKDLMKPHLQVKKPFTVNCLEYFTDEYYIHAQKLFEEFKLENLGEYHDLYVQSDTLFLAYIFIPLFLADINLLKYMNLILLMFYLRLD